VSAAPKFGGGATLEQRIRERVRDIPDFPREGILFKDITPILAVPGLLGDVVETLRAEFAQQEIARIVAIESRGFILGAPLAIALGCGFAPIRKIGKLPYVTTRVSYTLEYGTGELEAHSDSIEAGERVLIVDDLLATGGTAAAAIHLVRTLGGEPVAAAFLIELGFLAGRRRLDELPITALVNYD
jgi:adenine phosphoribosyltransferase